MKKFFAQFVLIVFCVASPVLLIYTVMEGLKPSEQYLIPQGVVICNTGVFIDLVEKDNYTSQEWDYIQKRAYEALQECK